MKTIAYAPSLCLIIAVLAGCAAGGMPVSESRSAPAQAYFAEGQTQEQAGHVVEAARMYKLALTLTPHDAAVKEALERVETRRRNMAEERFQRGEQAYAAGKFQESKIDDLAALRLWPEHAGALERLRAREKITATHHGKHIVQKGETLAIIAKKYYGDYKKYAVIARYNHMTDATQIEVGQEILIPEIGAGGSSGTTSPTTPATGEEQHLAAAAEESISEAVEIQVVNYRDAGKDMLETGDYPAAIVEFRKVLNVLPNDQEARRDLSRAYGAYARQLWDRNDIDQAREQFQACLAFRDNCPTCRPAVTDCENTYKERLYNRGIAFFQDENPEAALGEWETVQGLDPGYRNVQDYIQKAKKISEQLGRLKQKQGSP